MTATIHEREWLPVGAKSRAGSVAPVLASVADLEKGTPPTVGDPRTPNARKRGLACPRRRVSTSSAARRRGPHA